MPSSTSLPPRPVVLELVMFLRKTYPDHDIGSWPKSLAPSLKKAWEDIADAYRLALDPSVPWMQKTQKGQTYLRAAYHHHISGPDRTTFPTSARLSQAAQFILSQEKARQREEQQEKQTAQEPPVRDPSFSILRLYQEALHRAELRRQHIHSQWQKAFEGWQHPPRPLYRWDVAGQWTGDHEYDSSTSDQVRHVLGEQAYQDTKDGVWPQRAIVRQALGLTPEITPEEIRAKQRRAGLPVGVDGTEEKALIASRGLTNPTETL